jgi:hypothetical protein
MAIGAVLYSLLQIVMIGGLEPGNLVTGWAKPLGTDPSDFGAWYTLALAVGAGWLAKVLIIDAVISPAGTGVVYVGATARLSYALGEEREMPSALATTNKRVCRLCPSSWRRSSGRSRSGRSRAGARWSTWSPGRRRSCTLSRRSRWRRSTRWTVAGHGLIGRLCRSSSCLRPFARPT